MKPKHQRLLLICGAFTGVCLAGYLTLSAFQDSLVFFYTPSDLLQKQILPEQRIRIGGLVQPQSLLQKGESVSFKVTDNNKTLDVIYQGILPDLFKEGQGVVAEGYLIHSNLFQAESVLAKHDETYMPKEVADRLKEEGLCPDAQ